MALEFTDPNAWRLSPEEAVASRRKALDSYENIAEPALQEKQGLERGALRKDVYKKAANIASSGDMAQMGGLLGEAQLKAAQMLPEQGAEADKAQLLGAKAKEDIIASRQERAVGNYARNTEELKQKSADFIAKRAFEMGISARQLVMHQNGYLADKGLKQLYSDLQSGRENEASIREMQSRMALEAQRLRQEAEKEKARILGQLEIDLANKNLEAAKARMQKLMDMMKKAMESQAKSNMLKSFIGGVFRIGGAVAAGYATGGNPAAMAAGGMAGGEIGEGIGGAFGG